MVKGSGPDPGGHWSRGGKGGGGRQPHLGLTDSNAKWATGPRSHVPVPPVESEATHGQRQMDAVRLVSTDARETPTSRGQLDPVGVDVPVWT